MIQNINIFRYKLIIYYYFLLEFLICMFQSCKFKSGKWGLMKTIRCERLNWFRCGFSAAVAKLNFTCRLLCKFVKIIANLHSVYYSNSQSKSYHIYLMRLFTCQFLYNCIYNYDKLYDFARAFEIRYLFIYSEIFSRLLIYVAVFVLFSLRVVNKVIVNKVIIFPYRV